MHRLKTAAAGLVLTTLMLVGCGNDNVSSPAETRESSVTEIEILKDGSIAETITEDFSKDYYEEEGLKELLLSEVADFNKNSETGDIVVDKFENKKGSLTIRMKYPSAEVYMDYHTDAYNDGTFFCGTVVQAQAAGYSLDVTLKAAKGEETVGKEELPSMGESGIFISHMPMTVKLPGKICYISENVTVSGKNQAELEADENGEASDIYYVIFDYKK